MPFAASKRIFSKGSSALLLLFVLFSAGNASAQIGGAAFQGRVTDSTGNALPNVRLTFKNANTNSTRIAITDATGFFSAPNLLPGSYEMTAAHAGFVTIIADVSIAIGEQRTVNFQLHSGNSKESIRESQLGTRNQTQTSTVAGVADSDTVRDLPSNGRDWTQAATLQAGVSAVKTQPDANSTNSGRGQRGFGTQISVSGNRPQQNNYILNGTSINDYANSAPGSVLGLDLGADAVEQFSVVTSNYPADFGRSSGGVINAITRSGSNGFHGSIYEFLRNSALDAKNYFDSKKPPFHRNQFGAATGGPIKKDRTFFFANFEGLRQSLGVTYVDTVPSPGARNGILSTGNVSVDSQAARYLAFFPLPNRELLGLGDAGVFAFSGQVVTPESYFTGKIDHKFREQDSFSASYVFDNSQTTQPDQFDIRTNQNQSRRNVFSWQDRHVINPRFLNFLRIGVNRVEALIGQTPNALNPIAADTSYGFIPGHTSGNINVLGLTNFTGGLGAVSPFNFHWTSIQLYDDASVTSGSRSLRFGFAFERMRDNMFASTVPNGVFTFHSLSDFLTNRPFSLNIALPGTITPRDLRDSLFAAYIQYDLRVSPKFTLNLGLRYEMSTVPTETSGRLSALRSLTDPTPHLGSGYFANPTRANFEPRVGFAWDPLGKGRLVIRSGFGIFDVLPLPYQFELVSLFAAPYFENATPTNLPQGSFPSGASQIATAESTFRYVYIQPHPQRNYLNQWNLNLELQTSHKSSVLVGYVGSRGIHQPFRADDTNLVIPALAPSGYLWPTPVGSGTKINPNIGKMDGLLWIGDSYYDALQVQGNAVLSPGLQFQGSYTWGKSIDTGSATIAGDQFANSVSSLPWYDLRLNRGPSDFDIGQTFSMHFTYELPARGPLSGDWYLKDWRFVGTFQASTGAPFTAVIGGDPLGSKSTDPFDVPNVLTKSGCSSLVNAGNPLNYLKLQCFAFPTPQTALGDLRRNSLRGPGLVNLDISLFKDNYIRRISDKFNAQIRVEAFNVLNRANFAPPLNHRSIYDQNGNPVPGAGFIDSTATPSRQMQIGLKFIW